MAPEGRGIQTRLMRRQGSASVDPEPFAGKFSILLSPLSRIGMSFGQDDTDHGIDMVGQRHWRAPYPNPASIAVKLEPEMAQYLVPACSALH
ncbi:hypothetical protein [Sandarakinorhabdus sp.]|uniref:hypothetical protein n=1 Tax=Sandarakinorhabdus sp. TaxID=1916663 RepID=UPI003F70F329